MEASTSLIRHDPVRISNDPRSSLTVRAEISNIVEEPGMAHLEFIYYIYSSSINMGNEFASLETLHGTCLVSVGLLVRYARDLDGSRWSCF
jgi:hypothetical protein